MLSFKTHFHACAVKFSPFVGGLVAVATAQNFGIIGNGQQLILRVSDVSEDVWHIQVVSTAMHLG